MQSRRGASTHTPRSPYCARPPKASIPTLRYFLIMVHCYGDLHANSRVNLRVAVATDIMMLGKLIKAIPFLWMIACECVIYYCCHTLSFILTRVKCRIFLLTSDLCCTIMSIHCNLLAPFLIHHITLFSVLMLLGHIAVHRIRWRILHQF